MACAITIISLITIRKELPKSFMDVPAPFFDKFMLIDRIPAVLENIYLMVLNSKTLPDIYVIKVIFELINRVQELAGRFAEPFAHLLTLLLDRLGAQGYNFEHIATIFEAISAFYHFTNVFVLAPRCVTCHRVSLKGRKWMSSWSPFSSKS
jgi:hypothetical protein